MSEYERHNAPGQMGGYLFQPERALYWLAKSGRGGKVGIEVGDDIVFLSKNGNKIYEQDKHSISAGNPFRDKGKNLWNTLNIWLKSVKTDEVELKKTRFLLVTNKVVPDCLARDIGKAKDKCEVKKCIDKLRKIGKEPSNDIAKICNEVLSYGDDDLGNIIERISLCDGNDKTYGDDLREEVLDLLHVPENIPEEEIIHPLLGWVHDKALYLLRKRESIWLSNSGFNKKYLNTISKCNNSLFSEKAKTLISVTDSQRKSNMEQLFVKQLTALNLSKEDNQIIDAIDDFIMCASERTRFSKEGCLTETDFIEFEDRLFDRWKNIFDKCIGIYRSQEERLNKAMPDLIRKAEEVGHEILGDTLDHRESLAGQPTEQFYLTRGTYHRLANELKLGWHPDYKNMFDKYKGSDTSAI